MRTRIGLQLVVTTAVVTALTVGALVASSLKAHREALVQELHRSANQLSETIKGATLHDMLENRRDNLQRQIDTLGRQAGIRNVRVYNKEGRVVFSSDQREVGQSVNKRGEACYACHTENRPLELLTIKDRARTFYASDGQHLFGIITPIENSADCTNAACHAHLPNKRVLGVLDVTMSLDEVDRDIQSSQWEMLSFAALAIAGSSLVLWWLNRRLVIRPVEGLAEATRRVAAGDLSARVPVTAAHELGDLGRAFNEMAARLVENQRLLTQADKLASIGRLAAGVAHEINNPLTGVLTYASFLLNRAGDNPEMKEDLEVIVRETKRCREIVKGMLDFARQTPSKRGPTELNEVVRRAVKIVNNQLELARVVLELTLASDLPNVCADENQIQQVLVNMLLNAAHAIGSKGGQIRVTTRMTEGKNTVEVLVSDDGCGISEANLSHIFEPFFTTKGNRGTGLGLAVTWGIIEGHGGSIDVTSEEGKGTCFTVRLPRVAEAT